MLAITKKEFHQFFSSLTGYITITLFLVVNGLFLFVLKDSNILDFGYASLDAFFSFAPWVFIFLIPAVCMRMLSDEYRTGTFEILQTRPVTNWQIVTGKYIAGLVIILMTLLPTLLYVVTIKQLSNDGNIDTGGLAGSYLGLFFLSAVFISISLFCSGLSSNPLVSFLLSVFACLLLYFGFNAISSLPLFQGSVDYYLEMIGIYFHYRSISRGVMDTRDLVYFISIIFLFLFITSQNLLKK
jgi:ABC-2 type transport system permease protein